MSLHVVLALARAELRRTWPTLVAVGVLAGITAGTALGALAFALRTVSAPDRLIAATRLDDARVLLIGGSGLEQGITELPSVASSWVAQNTVGEIEGEGRDRVGKQYLSISSGPARPDDLFTPVMIDGRMPSDSAVDEIAITEGVSASLGMGVGDVLSLRMLEAAEVFQFDTGFGQPDGPLLELGITGVIRATSRGGNGFGPAFAGPAFDERYGDLSPGPTVLLRLDTDPDARGRLESDLASLVASVESDAQSDAESDAESDAQPAAQSSPQEETEFGPVTAQFSADELTPAVATARRVLGGGLLVFAAVAGLAGYLATSQALTRLATGRREDLRTERALGLVRAERVLGRLVPAGVTIGVAVVLAVAGVLLVGRVEPLGGLRAFEPAPGWRPDLTVAAWGSVVTALLIALAVVMATARAERVEERGRGEAAGGFAGLLGRPAPAVAGVFFAFAGRRTAVVGAALGIAGIVAVGVFAASAQQLEREPGRYGWNADFGIADIKDGDYERVVTDVRVRDVQTVTEAQALVAGKPTAIESREDRLGALPATVLEGRLPRTADEIALGLRTVESLGLRVGDQVPVGDDGRTATVTGIVVATPLAERQVGQVAVVTGDALARLQLSPPYATAYVRVVDGVDPAELVAAYGSSFELFASEPPTVVVNLHDLGALPVVLAAFLALLVLAALLHALLDVTRRRGRDLGVLRALGFTPRQVGAALLVMAGGVMVVGLLLGVPLGLVAGRLAWAEAAASIGIGGDAVLPVALLVWSVPAAVLMALLVALVPARRAARRSPAELLREE